MFKMGKWSKVSNKVSTKRKRFKSSEYQPNPEDVAENKACQ